MKLDIDVIERPKFIKKYLFPIREQVFIIEQGYSYSDDQVMCKEDAVSKHYIWLIDGEPAGVISLADFSGLDFILNEFNIDLNLKVVRPHKLAILKEARHKIGLKQLIDMAKSEIENFDYLIALTSKPQYAPDSTHYVEMAKKYHKIYGLNPIDSFNNNTIILTKDLRNFN